MKAVSVTYTVPASFAARNKENIQQFLQEVKETGDPGVRYNVFVAEDGKTFTHLSVYTNDESQSRFLALPSFVAFQQERDASGLEAAPKIQVLSLVASSHNLFS